MFYFFRKHLSTKLVKKIYLSHAASLGDALSYSYMGKCVGYKEMVKNEYLWRQELKSRGYKGLTSDEMISYGGYGQKVVLRKINETT